MNDTDKTIRKLQLAVLMARAIDEQAVAVSKRLAAACNPQTDKQLDYTASERYAAIRVAAQAKGQLDDMICTHKVSYEADRADQAHETLMQIRETYNIGLSDIWDYMSRHKLGIYA